MEKVGDVRKAKEGRPLQSKREIRFSEFGESRGTSGERNSEGAPIRRSSVHTSSCLALPRVRTEKCWCGKGRPHQRSELTPSPGIPGQTPAISGGLSRQGSCSCWWYCCCYCYTTGLDCHRLSPLCFYTVYESCPIAGYNL